VSSVTVCDRLHHCCMTPLLRGSSCIWCKDWMSRLSKGCLAYPQKCPFPWDLTPYNVGYGSSGPRKFTPAPQTSWLVVQPFLHRSAVCWTHRSLYTLHCGVGHSCGLCESDWTDFDPILYKVPRAHKSLPPNDILIGSAILLRSLVLNIKCHCTHL